MKNYILSLLAISLLLALFILLGGAQAKDFNERIGPYEVSFKLPDDIASVIEINKTVTSSETLDGVLYDAYALNLEISGIDRPYGWLLINHYNATWEMGLDKTAENTMGLAKGHGYTCIQAHRKIDGHEGYIVNCFGSDLYTSYYQFGYQLNNQTIVGGTLFLDWNVVVLPFLKSLHVEEKQ